MSPQLEQSAGRHTRRALCAVGAVAAIAIATTGCGSTELQPASAAPAVKVVLAAPTPAGHPARRTRTRTRTRTRVVYRAAPATVVHTSTGSTACGDGLVVGSRTSCSFAENVRAAYGAHGAGTVVAYSPVTRRTYAMQCSAAPP